MWYLSKKRENMPMKWKRKPKPEKKKKKHVCEGSLQVSGKGPTMECMTLQFSGSYTKDSTSTTVPTSLHKQIKNLNVNISTLKEKKRERIFL